MALRGTRGGCNGTREMKKVISHPDADRSRMYKQTEMALRGPAVSHLACNGTRENEESNFSSGCLQRDSRNEQSDMSSGCRQDRETATPRAHGALGVNTLYWVYTFSPPPPLSAPPYPRKSVLARGHPPTLSPEVSDAAASAVHARYTRLCTAEAAEA